MKNILLKLSGEALGNEGTAIFSVEKFDAFADAIKEGLAHRKTVYVVCGGGNVCRGRSFGNSVLADYAGMLASVQNALFLKLSLEKLDIPTEVVSPDNFVIPHTISESDISPEARVVIYAGGVGMPGHSTDFVCAVKAKEHDCDIYFAKNGCDGVYTCDPNPKSNPAHYMEAEFLPDLCYTEIVSKKLGVIDLEAAELLIDSSCASYIFELNAENVNAMLCGREDTIKKSVLH